MSKEVEVLKSTNKALQDSLMQNAQKMAKFEGDERPKSTEFERQIQVTKINTCN